MDKRTEYEVPKVPKGAFDTFDTSILANSSKIGGVSWLERLKLAEQSQSPKTPISAPIKRLQLPIQYEKPYSIYCFDAMKGYAVMRPYTETEWFSAELNRARDFLRAVYLKAIDTVILEDNALDLIQCGVKAHLLGASFNLFEPPSYEA